MSRSLRPFMIISCSWAVTQSRLNKDDEQTRSYDYLFNESEKESRWLFPWRKSCMSFISFIDVQDLRGIESIRLVFTKNFLPPFVCQNLRFDELSSYDHHCSATTFSIVLFFWVMLMRPRCVTSHDITNLSGSSLFITFQRFSTELNPQASVIIRWIVGGIHRAKPFRNLSWSWKI
jgi:hypothetical protein